MYTFKFCCKIMNYFYNIVFFTIGCSIKFRFGRQTSRCHYKFDQERPSGETIVSFEDPIFFFDPHLQDFDVLYYNRPNE